ncbi:MAG: CheR family methyltransferase, partial [Gemmatimonadales bacterium]
MAIQTQTFEFVRNLVHKRAAIVLEPGKEYLVESRLAPLARSEGFKSIDELVQRLAATAVTPLHTKVVEAMTTNETTFFRDLHPFEALRTVVLPRLIEARASTRRLTIWSAACSSGQEPVTLAMLIKEHFPQLATWRVSLLATDLSSAMVERTKAGRFSQLEINRGLPAPLLLKYFTKVGTDWLVREDIRAMIDCQVMNLATPWPAFPPMDLILMRNVLIYFDA